MYKQIINRDILVFILFLLFCTKVSAYPIFYECNSQEQEVEVVADNRFEEFAQKFFPNNDQSIENLCNGLETCIEEFKQIIELAKISETASNEELKKLLANISEKIKSWSHQISENIYSYQKSINELSKANLMCHQEKSNLPLESFLRQSSFGDIALLFYPYKSNYQYITGCRRLKKRDQCQFNQLKSLELGIEDSIIMGADPYVSLAIGLMEGGTNGIDKLYLDPIGKMAAMGCSGKHISHATKENIGLNSFGNLHKIEADIIQNSDIADRLENFLKVKKQQYENKESFLCRSVTDSGGIFSDSPQEGQCCLKVGFTPKTQEAANYTTRALTFVNIRNLMKRQFRNEEDPAFRIQRFNGYSKLMGGAEGVPAFRSGVDYYENPAYGYQAMDYIINSLMTNPIIRRLVEEKSKQTKSDYKSIICQGKKEGFYVIDSNYYFNKHRNSGRLKVIKEKFDQGLSFGDLTEREQRVFRQELFHPDVSSQLNSIQNTDKLSFITPISNLQGNNEVQKLMQEFQELSKDLFEKLGSNSFGPGNFYVSGGFQTKMSEDEFIDSLDFSIDDPNKKLEAIEQAKAVYQELIENQKKAEKSMKPWNDFQIEFQNEIGDLLGEGKIKLNSNSTSMSYSNSYTVSDITFSRESDENQVQPSNVSITWYGPQTVEDYINQYTIDENLPNKEEVLSKLRKLGTKYIELSKKQQEESKDSGVLFVFSQPGSKLTKFREDFPDAIKGISPLYRPATESEFVESLNIEENDNEMKKEAIALYKLNSKIKEEQQKIQEQWKLDFEKTKGQISTLKEEKNNKPQEIDYNKAMSEYFEKVYDKRDTVGKASDFSWERFSPEDISNLRDKIDTQLESYQGNFIYGIGTGF